MKTIHTISELGITISITERNPKHEQETQKTVRITNKRKLDVIGRVERVQDSLLRTAQIERKKEKKQSFFNKHKNK